MTELRATARAIFQAGLDASDPYRILRERLRAEADGFRVETERGEENGNASVHFSPPAEGGRLRVFGAGKAVSSLARAVEERLEGRAHDGRVIAKSGHGLALERIVVEEASHPLPDERGLAATRRLLEDVAESREGDRIFFLLTGGASALLVAPAEGIELEDKIRTNDLLLRSGATIREINTVRKHLSAVKGGRLLEHMAPASVLGLVVSDVLGDDLSSIGSGPAVPDPTTFADGLAILERHGLRESVPASVGRRLADGAAGRVAETPKPGSPVFRRAHHVVLASNRRSLHAGVAEARSRGLEASVFAEDMEGDVHERAEAFARELARRRGGAAPRALLAGGELTLEVRGTGRGGRNQEFALVAALALAGERDVVVLSAGTDGTDGPTDAAGAFADGSTVARGEALGLDARRFLENNDAYSFFDRLSDLLKTGPTGTNVNDLVVGLAAP